MPSASLTPTQLDAPLKGAGGGRLHLFLGMGPGVGKTQAMLQAARLRQVEGERVLPAFVETHGQPALGLLLKDFPSNTIANRASAKGGIDVDAVLKQVPKLVLVDDLASTNPPGSRHAKRYQTVLELLDAGVDVYATLDVYQIHSQAQILRQTTGLAVSQEVPDSVIDQAQEIQLIDISVEEWRRRKADGRVSGESNEGLAAASLDQTLPALREMALRFTTAWVDGRSVPGSRSLRGGEAGEANVRLLVGVGPSPYAEGLIRWTSALASKLGCPWLAVWVEGPRSVPARIQEQLARSLHLVRKLGGEAITMPGNDIPTTLLRLARERNASQIIVGKTDVPSAWRQSLADRLIQDSGGIDISVIRPLAKRPIPRATPPVVTPPSGTLLAQYSWAVALPLVVSLACWLITPFTGYMFVGTVLLLAVVFAALRLSRGPVFLMATLSVLAWDYFFIPPSLSLRIEKIEDMVMCALFYVVALSMLAALLRQREVAERRRAQQSAALLKVTQSAALSVDPEKGLAEALRTIEMLLHSETALVVRLPDGSLANSVHPASTFLPAKEEWEVIHWSYEHQQPAGRFTGVLPGADATWYPLETSTSVIGAFGVKMVSGARLDFSARQTIEAFALQLALVFEKENTLQVLRKAEMAEASERLRRTLLDSVSHELKTPLAALQAATDGLEREPSKPERYMPELRAALRRLRRTVDNLLDMTRLEAGAIKPIMDWCDIGELFDAALDFTADALSNHVVERDIPDDLPMVSLDQALMEQALANLLLNAAMHTPAGSEVTLRARVHDQTLTITVLDRGPGLPPGDTEALFQKFARGQHAPCGGSGLGLAIARGFASAHGGTATARPRKGGGAEFALTLPADILDDILPEISPSDRAHC